MDATAGANYSRCERWFAPPQLHRFRRYYPTGRLKGHYELKFDDGDLADIELPSEDYGDANTEDGWLWLDEEK